MPGENLPNPSDAELKKILQKVRSVAVVGLSPNPERDSHKVAAYLKEQGYRIIPVNPTVPEILGEKSYPDLAAVPGPMDVVDVFRRSEAVPEIAGQAVQKKAKILWLQRGVRHEKAAAQAREAGLTVVQDTCIKVNHQRLLGQGK
jgi:predicted CoA-binding protein